MNLGQGTRDLGRGCNKARPRLQSLGFAASPSSGGDGSLGGGSRLGVGVCLSVSVTQGGGTAGRRPRSGMGWRTREKESGMEMGV